MIQQDFVDQFRDAMRSSGIEPPAEVVADGELHRFGSNGPTGHRKNGDDAGWYVFHPDGIPAGAFGDWRTGAQETWCSKSQQDLTDEEREANRERLARAKAARAAEDERRRAEARTKAAALWQAAVPAGADHPYLARKRVQPVASLRELDLTRVADILGYTPRARGDYLSGRILLVPVKVGLDLSTMEMIDEAGRKSAIAGGRKAGGYWATAPLPDGDGSGYRIFVGEGVATVATVSEITGDHAVAALSSGNLKAVATAMRERFPAAELVVLADIGNGQADAEEAAQAIAGKLATPDFGPNRLEDATDFNDLARLNGAAAVLRAIEAAHAYDETHMAEEASALEATSRSGDIANENDGLKEGTAAYADTVTRLAALSPLEYDKCRKSEAEALGVRASTLDAEVREARRQAAGDTDGSGTSLTFDAIEPWPEPVDGAALLDEISALFSRYAVLPEHSATVLALWSVFSHMHAAAPVCPMLLLSSPVKGCGKTTVLSVLDRLVYRPLAASNVTAAAMFRAIEAWTPTLLIDEADSFARDNEELRGVLNSGHTRTSAFVLRTVGDDHEPRQFSTWCPKALAGIGKLPGTVMDRSVIVGMRRKARGEQVARLRPRQRFDDTRSRIARWAGDHLAEFGRTDPEIPGELANRTADNWTPLLAIADISGGEWPARARAAALAMADHDVDGDGIGVRLLADIRTLFQAKQKTRYPSAELLRDLTELEEAPWSEYNRGKPINARGLARLLSGFDVVVGTIRVGPETPKGYRLEQFDDAFSRYLAPEARFTPSQSATPAQANAGAGCGGFAKRNAEEMLRNEIPPQPNAGAGCAGVADSNPGKPGFARSVSETDDEADL